jgi:hypothetical protein
MVSTKRQVGLDVRRGRDALGREALDELEHLAEYKEIAERHANEEQHRAGNHQRQDEFLLVRVQARRHKGPELVQHDRHAIRKAAISRIFNGTMNGEITDVAIRVAPCGQGRDQRRRQQVVKPARPRIQAQRDGRSTAMASSMALISRSRNSTRCATNGCSVPASSSSALFWGSDMVNKASQTRGSGAAEDG